MVHYFVEQVQPPPVFLIIPISNPVVIFEDIFQSSIAITSEFIVIAASKGWI